MTNRTEKATGPTRAAGVGLALSAFAVGALVASAFGMTADAASAPPAPAARCCLVAVPILPPLA